MQRIANRFIKELIFGSYEISKCVLFLSAVMYALWIDLAVDSIFILSFIIYIFSKMIIRKKESVRDMFIIQAIIVAGYLFFLIDYDGLFQLSIMFIVSIILIVRAIQSDVYERNFSAFKLSFWMVNILYFIFLILFGLFNDYYYLDDFGIFIPIMIIMGIFKIMYLNISIAYQKKYRNVVDYEKNLFRFTLFNIVGVCFLGILFTIDKAIIDLNVWIDWLIENVVLTIMYPIFYLYAKINNWLQGITLEEIEMPIVEPSKFANSNYSWIDQLLEYLTNLGLNINLELIIIIAQVIKWLIVIGIIYIVWKVFLVNKSDEEDVDGLILEKKSYMSGSEIKNHYKNRFNKFNINIKSPKSSFFKYYWKTVEIFDKKMCVSYEDQDTALEYQKKVAIKTKEDISMITKDYNDIVYGGKTETKDQVESAKLIFERIKNSNIKIEEK